MAMVAIKSTIEDTIMKDLELAKTSNSVILDILGFLRWAQPSAQGGWDVEEAERNGKTYMEYHTFSGNVVWDVKEHGGYPDEKEWEELEKALD
jgi:hypothetical protein